MNYISKECLHCKKNFQADEREVKRGNAKFCSHSCCSKHSAIKNAKKPNVSCAKCFKEFYKTPKRMKASKSGLFFCCRACKDAAQRINGIKEIQPPHYGTGNGTNTYRNIAFLNKQKQCERCGYNTHEAAIIVHHKDRNRENNALENLEVLCSNCHAIEHWG